LALGNFSATILNIVLTKIARFLQVLTTGLYTGLLFADRIGVSPIRPKLPASSFVLFQQELHLRFGKLMPVLLISSLVAGITWLILERRHYQRREFIFTAVAIVCTVGVIILTRLINVPINETLMTWQASSPPENVMQLWAPWEGSHTIRTVIAFLGFASLAYAVSSNSEAHDVSTTLR
jgi:uncharacterized membrane protein